MGTFGTHSSETGYFVDWVARPARNSEDQYMELAGTDPSSSFSEATSLGRNKSRFGRRKTEVGVLAFRRPGCSRIGRPYLFHVEHAHFARLTSNLNCSTWNNSAVPVLRRPHTRQCST